MEAVSLALDAVMAAAERCEKVKELKPMFESVCERHARLLKRIKDAEPDDKTLEKLLAQQQKAFEEFKTYTDEVSGYSWFKRIYRLGRIGKDLEEQIDKVERAELELADTKERVNDAARRATSIKFARLNSGFTRMSIQMTTNLSQLSKDFENLVLIVSQHQEKQASKQILVNKELQKPGALEEVTMLRYEFEERKVDNPAEHVKVMGTVLAAVFKTEIFQKPEYESWFLSTNVVDFDNTVKFEHNEIIDVQPGEYDGMKVAVKRMRINSDRRAMNQFKRELGSWTKVQHENVVRLFGACDATSPAFFVYESTLCNFNDYFNTNRTKGNMWRLFYQAALGLKHLHRKQIVHGDIRGANLLVGKDGLAKVSGFGFSRARQISESLSNRPESSSNRWRAPECLEQVNSDPRQESDIYSFGVCIWEIASNNDLPYGTVDDLDAKEMILSRKALEKPESMEDDEWQFVQSLLEFEMDDRPDINAVVDQLQELALLEASAIDDPASDSPQCPQCKAELRDAEAKATYA